MNRSLAWFTGLCLAATGGLLPVCVTFAQAETSAQDARRRLDSDRQALDEAQRRAKSLQTDVATMREERERLNTRLLETAKLVQASEAQLSSIETRLGDLSAQEKGARATLAERHGSIMKLLGAMQRMGRNPPPVMVTQREDALKMVRSAMLLAAAFPHMRSQATALQDQLNQLVQVMTSIRTEGERLRSETQRLSDARLKLAGLVETRKQSLVERQAELEQVSKTADDIKKSVTDLSELISRLDKAVEDNTGLGAYQRQLDIERKRADAQPALRPTMPAAPADPAPVAPPAETGEAAQPVTPQITSPTTTAQAPQPPPIATPQPRPKVAVARPSVELAPSGDRLAMATPGRIAPDRPFSQAKGRLPLPAQGRRVINFGDRMQNGRQSQGIVIETRPGATVTSPADGWIVFSGEFRSYGQLLIINTGDGYHLLLAGLSQIDVQTGQFVLAGEPVGTMTAAVKAAGSKAQDNASVLFIEFRKEGRSIDPDPWWSDGARKVQG